MKRDALVDRLKGYACLLVLFGHVILGVRTSGITTPSFMLTAENFIWSFHIDLFMFLSGFVYRLTGGCTAKGSRLSFIANKLLNLGVPYLLFSIVYIAANAITPGVNHESSLFDILLLWYKPVAQYWFLYALFWLFVLWTVLSKWFNHPTITILLFTILTACKIFQINLGFLDSSLHCALAFGLGTCLPSLYTEKIPKAVQIAAPPLHLITVVTLLISGCYSLLFIDDVCTVFGIFASICFIFLLTKINAVARFLDLVCRCSFPIYLLHTFFTAAMRIVLLKCGIHSYVLHLILGTAIGLAAPIAIAKITSKSPYLNFVFYPSRSIKQIRARKR